MSNVERSTSTFTIAGMFAAATPVEYLCLWYDFCYVDVASLR
jgi:hypothetical protein